MDKHNLQHAAWDDARRFTVKTERRYRDLWWGCRAEAGQRFWFEPCVTLQLSSAWPWLRIASSYRLRTADALIATVEASVWTATKLLEQVLIDIEDGPR